MLFMILGVTHKLTAARQDPCHLQELVASQLEAFCEVLVPIGSSCVNIAHEDCWAHVTKQLR